MEHVYHTGVPLKEGRILRLILSVCEGLEAMHTCSAGPVVHNDVKVSKVRVLSVFEVQVLCVM